MLKPFVRKSIFWSFLIFFFISAPLSVLYTAGYRYNFTNGQILKTGSISIVTEPRNATIYLNQVATEKSTPYVFKRILPAEYDVSIKKEGFLDWRGTVQVKSSITTNLQPVTLFKDSTIKNITKKDIEAISYNGNSKFAFLSNQSGWSELWFINTTTDETKMISRMLTDSISKSVILSWSNNGKNLLLFDSETKLFNLFNQDGQVLNVDTTSIKKATSVFWHPSDDNILYIKTNNSLTQINLIDNSVTNSQNKNKTTVVLDASLLNFINNGSAIELWQTNNNSRELITILPIDDYKIEERDGTFIILSNSKNKIILINIHDSQPILLNTYATAFDWLPEIKSLVWTDGIEVDIYDYNSHSTDFITRTSKTINSIMWDKKGNNIFLTDNDSLYAIERYQISKKRLITTLAENLYIKNIWLSEDGKTLYFTKQIDNKTTLYNLDILR